MIEMAGIGGNDGDLCRCSQIVAIYVKRGGGRGRLRLVHVKLKVS